MVFKIWIDLSSVLSQCTRLTDGQRTDGQTEFSSLDRVCIPYNMKRGKNQIFWTFWSQTAWVFNQFYAIASKSKAAEFGRIMQSIITAIIRRSNFEVT